MIETKYAESYKSSKLILPLLMPDPPVYAPVEEIDNSSSTYVIIAPILSIVLFIVTIIAFMTRSCPVGQANGILGCYTCPYPNSYNLPDSSYFTSCSACKAGFEDIDRTNSVHRGIPNCEKCPEAHYSEAGGVCTVCTPNTWADAGSQFCLKCAAGYYATLATRSHISGCMQCPVPSTSNPGAQTKNDCVCPAGQEDTDPTDGITCVECAKGHYSDQGGKCKKCQDGSWSMSSGAAFCTECAAGYFGDSSTKHNKNCRTCNPSGTITMTKPGAVDCGACKEGYQGSDCYSCAEGYLLTYSADDKSSACVKCREGFTGTGGKCNVCAPGYVGRHTLLGLRSQTVCNPCLNGGTSPKGSHYCQCLNGYSGDDCSITLT